MNPMTMRAVSLGVVVAVWTAISEMARVNLSLWPVLVALGCSLALVSAACTPAVEPLPP